MGILATAADERVKDVRVTEDNLIVDLMDGRTISVPLAKGHFSPQLRGQLRTEWHSRISGFGTQRT